jgi:hypothetical protein
MPYTPPGYTAPAAIEPGVQTLYLKELKQIDGAKANCNVCYVATYRNAEGHEITDWMKWGANPMGDKIASERMDHLIQAAGMTGTPTLKVLEEILANVPLEVEVKQNGSYLNVWSVKAASASTPKPGEPIPF